MEMVTVAIINLCLLLSLLQHYSGIDSAYTRWDD